MQRILFTFFLVLTVNTLCSQASADSIYLSVIGRFVAPLDTIGHSVTIGFHKSHQLSNDKNESETISTLISIFKKNLAAAGIDSSDVKQDKSVMEFPLMENRYIFSHADPGTVAKVAQIAAAVGIQIYHYNILHTEQTLVHQYVKATLALNDAVSKSKIIARHLNLKIDKIISIDDETSDRIINTGRPYADRHKAEYNSFVRELAILVSTSWSDIYTLKVRFLLVKE